MYSSLLLDFLFKLGQVSIRSIRNLSIQIITDSIQINHVRIFVQFYFFILFIFFLFFQSFN